MSSINNWNSDYSLNAAKYLEDKLYLLTRLQNIADSPTLSRRSQILKLLSDLKGETKLELENKE